MATEGYLLDTNIASWACHKGSAPHRRVRARVDSLGGDVAFISAISLAEVEYGLNLVPSGVQKPVSFMRAMDMYKVLPIDRHTAEVYGRIRADLFRAYAPRDRRDRVSSRHRYIEDLRERTSGKGLGIQENDLWIVSVAVEYNLIFVTGDRGGGMKKIVEAANYAHRTQYWN